MSDLTTLVTLAQGGDPAAYDHIVRRFQDGAVGYGYSLFGDFSGAEDAAQEAFLQAFRDLRSLEQPAAFPAWFRKIIYKCCHRAIRRKQLPLAPLDEARDAACPASDPAQALESAETRAELHAAVRALPEAEREVISLFYIGEHSQQEIALFLQVPVTTVKKRLQRARVRLRDRLRERMLPMLEDTFRGNAPSHDQRFVERAKLLRAITGILERDESVGAAWLAGALGRGNDDAWSAPKVNVVVADDRIDALATGRRAYAGQAGERLLLVEAPQNATAGGYYLMALYDGEAGPYEVDWYWHRQSTARLPLEARTLFDRVGLPPSGEPMPMNNSEPTPAQQRVWDTMTEAERRASDAANGVSLFWAMLLITAKYVARPMLRGLLRDARAFAGAPAVESEDRPHAEPAAKLAVLRGLSEEMERMMPRMAARGAEVPSAVVPRAQRFLAMVEASLRAEGKL